VRINEQEITFTKKRGVKHLRIRIKGNGTCTVTVPFRVPMVLAERFVAEKRAWIVEKQATMKERAGERRILGGLRPFHEVRQEALRFTTQEVAKINRNYGFTYTQVAVRNQKTRWGSCSTSGSLSFNYRIMYLPPHLAEYLIVHEVCHLKEPNHGERFWRLVERKAPDYKNHRKELKKYTLT
jgi:predicted metal-dependent hydrolase